MLTSPYLQDGVSTGGATSPKTKPAETSKVVKAPHKNRPQQVAQDEQSVRNPFFSLLTDKAFQEFEEGLRGKSSNP